MNRSLSQPPLRRCLPRLLVLAALALPGGRALAEPSRCSLGIPGASVIRVTTNVAANAWLATNYAYSVMALGVAPTNAVSTLDPEMIGDELVRLEAVEAGFAVERIKPQYWLADRITPPANVDWNATYTEFIENNANQDNFFFDTAAPALYAAGGGSARFTWVLTDGQKQEFTYIIGSATQGRPRRIFWTDWPYEAPAVNLAGKFVKFFGNPDILTSHFGIETNIVGGISQVVSNKITRGLFVDQTTKMLFAVGGISGQVLMVYYDSGSYETPLLVQTIEVARPQVIPMRGVIGEPLRPNGSGYDIDGLSARPTVVQETDNRGPYLYQHQGAHSYSPKHGNVYPLRPTVGARWNAEVYWMETDELQVQWPFELCQYECDWPVNIPVFVRGTLNGADGEPDYGRPIFIPDGYTATLMSYQDPEGHARAVEPDGTFVTYGTGWSLLQLTTEDNIWFLPVHSVPRDDPDRFTLAPSDLEVGLEAELRGGSVSGIAPGWSAPAINPSLPGYLYRPASGTAYNPTLYHDPVADGNSTPDTSGLDETGSSSNALPSAVFLVTVDGKTLEVWWCASFLTDDMPAAIAIPSLPQVYNPVWPKASQVQQIVIASQLGSANETIYEQGGALVFDSTNSCMELPKRAYFTQDGGAIHFWTRACDSAAGYGQLLNLRGGGNLPFSLSIAAKVIPGTPAKETYRLMLEGPGTIAKEIAVVDRQLGDPFQWMSVGLARSGTTFRLYLDGQLALTRDLPAFSICEFDASLDSGFLGAARAEEARPNREIAEISFWNKPFDAEAFRTLAYRKPVETDHGLTGYFAFEDGRDLNVVPGSNLRTAYERLHNYPCVCRNVLLRTPGAPAMGAGIIDADDTPIVYAQPDRAGIGYNPNEEHAFVRAGSGGHVVWALRCDLNTTNSSPPGVLIQYEKDGRARMQYFAVVLTNSVYPELAANCVAGLQLPGPHPLDYLDDPWLDDTYWDPPPEGQSEPCGFRDRKRQVWARCAGTLPIHMYYPMQEGFWFPSLSTNEQPAVGAPIPWLSQLGGHTPNPNSAPPACWTWRITWPKEVPEMAIGQTLTLPAGGLPEVWNAKSMAVVYPDPAKDSDTVLLYDPTVAQEVAFDPNHLAALGLKTGSNEKLLSRKGKYWFQDISPAISSRVYIDPVARTLVCIGAKEDNPGGVELLHVNVLSDAERQTIRELVDPSLRTGNAWKAWEDAVNALATKPVVPTDTYFVNTTDLRIDYIPTDHYALTAMGATNYVVLIENDATNRATGVSPGDPISMQVLRVVPRYFTGRVVTREDPLNLLSQQLSVLYEEPFAGQADDYLFQWKKATPNPNGTIPTDYDNAYHARFPDTAGLTRFVIGAQGDTLANMVNTYYIMRYRAAPGTPAHAIMGDQWSAWCAPPALAEGWVQRVLNNVTPFTQRMQDLYENEAEDAVSMIRQAGAPYEGDVALNQDNLLNVGLIQLYQTVLNKAETMSLLQRTNDGDANKQLLLAVQRLADLYTVLGDEAYTDAMNPTIAIGANYGVLEGGLGLGYDYGAIASGLFCFDNQLPNLLEEELALLRGRSGANAPGTTIGPYYNRLVWNFTRGITAGEVAYAVNYNISGEKTATIDYQQAATAFPQGHGDAYGHYLSALAGYYRLLRNPFFSWGVPAMGEMVVADNVVNVDYYDESTFAKAAANVARTAVDVVDRTARKAWKEADAGAGYLDSDASRAFGYGEWASRGGYGALCNWVVANSLLPEAGGLTNTYSMHFTGDSILRGELPASATTTNAAASWTLEFRLQPDAQPDTDVSLITWMGETIKQMLQVRLSPDGTLGVRLNTNALEIVDVDGTLVTNYVTVTVWAFDTAPVALVPGRAYLAALSHRGDTESVDLRVFDANSTKIASCTLDIGTMPGLAGGYIFAGLHYKGALANFRFWTNERSDEALIAGWEKVSPVTQGLVSSLPMTTTSADDDTVLIDEASGLAWKPNNVFWHMIQISAVQETLNDQGLLRIDRGSVTELSELAECVRQIQTKTDAMDRGLNPLGLSEGAIPFDLSPLGENEAGATHFEQIRDRARVALKNAATILNEAQENGSRLRQIEDARAGYANQLDTMELTYKNDLIALFGYPYSGDIGPSGTYPQGYDGPDLIHYMWMDLAPYGLTDVEDTKSTETYIFSLTPIAEHLFSGPFGSCVGTNRFSLAFSASGLVLKPESVTGARRAPGEIQQAYGNYLQSYAKVKRAIYLCQIRTHALEGQLVAAQDMRGTAIAKFGFAETLLTLRTSIAANTHRLKRKLNKAEMKISSDWVKLLKQTAPIPKVAGGGLGGAVADPNAAVEAAVLPPAVVDIDSSFAKKRLIQNQLVVDFPQALLQQVVEGIGAYNAYSAELRAITMGVVEAFNMQIAARDELESAWGEMIAAQAAFEVVVAKAQRLLESRELERQQAAVALTKLRYHNMFFRQTRNESLARYSAAFDLAQKYVYLAAKAYDYETGLLASDPEAGDAFLRDIIGARALGVFDADGNPVTGGGVGDPGLADIMARMDANWLVLKTRLGINNPQPYATWFSLRKELFRILPGPEGDGAWKTELAKYWVDNLLTLPEYRRYCQPFQAIGGLQTQEPGLAIPFSSTIDFAKNFFGNDLAGEDSALDSTYFATKIAEAGIFFDGYNEKLNGYTGTAPFALTPTVYLIPIGDDRMRAPGLEDGTVLSYRIVDQVVPLPYTVGSTHLDNPDWMPLYDGYTGGVDLAARIRKYPSFRAYFGAGGTSSAYLDCPRLVGRSAWNTRWLLIIPAGTLNANRDDALRTFINGKDANRDGIVDLSGVTDIRLGLKTYSHSGN